MEFDTYNSVLPIEMIFKIMYQHKGLYHHNSKLINNYMNDYLIEKKCFMCEKNDISLSECPISYINLDKLIFIKKEILNQNGFDENNIDENKLLWLCFDCCH
jgi:hypothetical protein